MTVHQLRFELGARVFVRRDGVGNEIHCAGTVTRLRRADNGAWISLDQRSSHCPFPEDDRRANHIVAYPEDCGAVP